MAQFFFKVSIICINIFIIYASSSAFSEVLDDTKQCEEKCTKSFAPHTYPNGSDNNACMRGCRLYTVTSYATADEVEHTNTIDDNGLSPAKMMCYRSCIEAYNETSSNTTNCKVGCDAQELVSFEKAAGKAQEEGGIHLLKPVMQIREVVSKVVGFLRIVQSSLTVYFLRDDNELVAVEGPLEVMVQVIPPREIEEEQQEAESNEQERLSDSDSLLSSGTASIECLSRKVGVPPYLLIVSLVSFIIFLSYILFVICSSNSKKEKKMKSGMSISSHHTLPVKLVLPEDLTKLSLMDEEEGHAPALPSKVKLPNSSSV